MNPTGDPPIPTTLGGWLAQNTVMLAVVAAVVAFVWIKLDPVTVALVAVGLGLVIFIHELGHFLAAKWCDVHVETFSIGFGPPLPGLRFRYGETAYQVALVPLGGYVKMVGEGNEDEGEDDPRSFKNKSVGQRMLIISAGVVMNIIFAAVCFVGIFRTTGLEHAAGVIGTVDSGAPAWQKGLRPGAKIVRIGETDHPFFDDVTPEVMHSKAGQPVPVTYETFAGGKATTIQTDVIPRANNERGRPMIGIGPARSAALAKATRKNEPPVAPDTAAARAEPALQNGDRIVGATDPDQPAETYQASKTTPLLPDPRDPAADRRDYFDLAGRLRRLADREITIVVRRDGQPDAPITIPPQYHSSYGFRLGMGPIVAIRDGSTAATAGVQVRNGTESGDTIFQIEIAEPDGRAIRYTSATGPEASDKVRVEPLDPARLPEQLRAWAARKGPGKKEVKVSVKRKVGHNEIGQDQELSLAWDDSWGSEPSTPSSEASPRAIDELGLAYTIKPQIDGVDADSPAAKAVVAKDGKFAKDSAYPLKKGDVIKAVRFYKNTEGTIKLAQEYDVGPDQGAFLQWLSDEVAAVRQMGLVIKRGDEEPVEVHLDGVEDHSRPSPERGIDYQPDLRLQRASSISEALAMGVQKTWRIISQNYQNLGAMTTGRVSVSKNLSGPVGIANLAYAIAGSSLSDFVVFLGMISITLAVINFLPIPILDGGHMVFLIYEKLRGRPAPEAVHVAATFVGLAMIASLLLFAIVLDVKRLL
jgi:regulator of sigma E protease